MQQNSNGTKENILKRETSSEPGSHVTKLPFPKATTFSSFFGILTKIV